MTASPSFVTASDFGQARSYALDTGSARERIWNAVLKLLDRSSGEVSISQPAIAAEARCSLSSVEKNFRRWRELGVLQVFGTVGRRGTIRVVFSEVLRCAGDLAASARRAARERRLKFRPGCVYGPKRLQWEARDRSLWASVRAAKAALGSVMDRLSAVSSICPDLVPCSDPRNGFRSEQSKGLNPARSERVDRSSGSGSDLRHRPIDHAKPLNW